MRRIEPSPHRARRGPASLHTTSRSTEAWPVQLQPWIHIPVDPTSSTQPRQRDSRLAIVLAFAEDGALLGPHAPASTCGLAASRQPPAAVRPAVHCAMGCVRSRPAAVGPMGPGLIELSALSPPCAAPRRITVSLSLRRTAHHGTACRLARPRHRPAQRQPKEQPDTTAIHHQTAY